MSYRLSGKVCSECDRKPPRPARHGDLCTDCYRALNVTARAKAIRLCKDAAAMQRTLNEIQGLEETRRGSE